MTSMTGKYHHTIDAKGRLCIPSSLRDDLGETFYVSIWMEPCLVAHTKESWEKRVEKFNAMPAKDQKKIRPFFANAAKCDVDSQGRILLPQDLRDRVGLKKNATVVGVGERAEIWDAEAWAKIETVEESEESLEDAFEELGF